jgi:hypothetical protein
MSKNFLKFSLFVFFLVFTNFAFSDGRPILPGVVFHENEFSEKLGFKKIREWDRYVLATDEFEYFFYFISNHEKKPFKATVTVWLETRNGFGPMKREPYAIVEHMPASVSGSEKLDAFFNDRYQLVLSDYKGVTIEYPHGIFVPVPVKTAIYLESFVNESKVKFKNTLSDGSLLDTKPKINQIQNSSFIESTLGKYAILFEDKGWVEFVPENQKMYPLRQVLVWVEERGYVGSPNRVHYATVFYKSFFNIKEPAATKLKNVPISIHIDNRGFLTILSTEDVVYQLDIIKLNN